MLRARIGDRRPRTHHARVAQLPRDPRRASHRRLPTHRPGLVDEVVSTHLAERADYTSNTLLRTYPTVWTSKWCGSRHSKTPPARAHDAAEREHVTPFIYRDPDRYRLAAHIGPADLEDERWTVDTAEDFAFIEDALSTLADEASTIDWHALIAIVGRRYAVDDDSVVLHVRRPGAIGRDIGPLGEPGTARGKPLSVRHQSARCRFASRHGTGTIRHVGACWVAHIGDPPLRADGYWLISSCWRWRTHCLMIRQPSPRDRRPSADCHCCSSTETVGRSAAPAHHRVE